VDVAHQLATNRARFVGNSKHADHPEVFKTPRNSWCSDDVRPVLNGPQIDRDSTDVEIRIRANTPVTLSRIYAFHFNHRGTEDTEDGHDSELTIR
jgi:hypothetical protein